MSDLSPSKKRQRIEQVENIINTAPFQKDVYYPPTESDRLISKAHRLHWLKPPLEGVDLGDLKHYQHNELIRYVGRGRGIQIGMNMRSSMFHGVVNYDGEERQVLIKTFNVRFPNPISSDRASQPKRFYNEIQLLTEEPMKSHPNVPKLIGYSIDKMLAVVYDLKAKYPLHHIIREDVALCTRVSMTAKIGHILQSFHDKGIGIGCI
ncbi:hypothetical protein Leryth_019123 [Lithospermum erythrorhizon]|nr:hypothetical protein Leryth_019123 [Lithospermum erythrorhizon]